MILNSYLYKSVLMCSKNTTTCTESIKLYCHHPSTKIKQWLIMSVRTYIQPI